VGVWKDLGVAKESSHPLGLQECHQWWKLVPVGWGLPARRPGRSVSFIRVPCVTAGPRGIEEWTVEVEPPVTPFRPIGFAVYPPEYVLAVVELKDLLVGQPLSK